MKMRLLTLLTSIAGMMLLFSSCKKEMEPAKADEIMGTPLPSATTYCRIESFWQNPGSPGQTFRLIGYDQFENPTFISTPFVATGTPFRTFSYDTWHRMREFAEVFANGSFNSLHRYGFNNDGRIGVDTVYLMGGFENGQPANYWKRTISNLTYDAQGRIIHSSNHTIYGPAFPLPPESSVNTYTYDAWGNLVLPGVTYDNKVSLLRTNDIWMFLARDYSVNNPFTASSYNSSNYPTVLNLPTFYRFANMDEIILTQSQIGYGCRPSNYH